VVCVRKKPQLLLGGKHGLLAICVAVKRQKAWCRGCLWMLAEIFLSSKVLVKPDDNAALPPAAQPVSVRTLHAVCHAVLVGMAAPTHESFAVALFAEDLEDCEHSAPSSDYAIVYPRNRFFVPKGSS